MTKSAGELNLGLLYGPRFRDNFDVLMRNIVSGKLLDKAHHCIDKDCNGKALKRSCWTKLHIAFCQADILDGEGNVMRDENGRRIVCGERFNILSPAGCFQHQYAGGHNLDFKALRNDWKNHDYVLFDRMRELEELEKGVGQEIGDGNEQVSKKKMRNTIHTNKANDGKTSYKATEMDNAKLNTIAGVPKRVRELKEPKQVRATGTRCSSGSGHEAEGCPKVRKGQKKQKAHLTFSEMKRGKKA
jgi:hypothetical protein